MTENQDTSLGDIARPAEDKAGRMQEDLESGARYIYLRDVEDGGVKRTDDLGRCHVLVDYDGEGGIVGVELLAPRGASAQTVNVTLGRAEVVDGAGNVLRTYEEVDGVDLEEVPVHLRADGFIIDELEERATVEIDGQTYEVSSVGELVIDRWADAEPITYGPGGQRAWGSVSSGYVLTWRIRRPRFPRPWQSADAWLASGPDRWGVIDGQGGYLRVKDALELGLITQ